MTTEELNKIDKCRHLLPEPAPEVVGQLVEQLRGYDKHLRVCMGWTMRASELEVSSGMQEAQLADLKAAESFLANDKDLAQLFVASPQILAALQRLEKACDAVHEVSGGTPQHEAMWLAQLEARDAITEATGIPWQNVQAQTQQGQARPTDEAKDIRTTMSTPNTTAPAVDLPRLVRHWMRQEMAEAIGAKVTQECFVIRDFTGGQPDETVIGKDAAELRAMSLMLWYPNALFQILPNGQSAGTAD